MSPVWGKDLSACGQGGERRECGESAVVREVCEKGWVAAMATERERTEKSSNTREGVRCQSRIKRTFKRRKAEAVWTECASGPRPENLKYPQCEGYVTVTVEVEAEPY